MKKIRPVTIVLTLALIAVFVEVVVFFYYAFAPVKVLEIKSIAVLNPNATVTTGQSLVYRVEYCKYRDAQSASVKALVGDVTYPLPTGHSNVPVGCHTAINRGTIVPVGVLPGTYRLSIDFSYQVNRLHTVHVHATSSAFTVVTGTQGALPTQSVDSYAIGAPTTISSPSSTSSGSNSSSSPAPANGPAASPEPTPASSPGLIGRVLTTVGGLVSPLF